MIVVGILALLAAGAWFEPTHVVRGWIRGEQFFQGRPVSWWHQQLLSTEQDNENSARLRLTQGGAESVPVLVQLLKSPDAKVRMKTVEMVSTMGESAVGAAPAVAAVEPYVYV